MANIHESVELRRERAGLVKQMEEVLNRSKEEKRSLTVEENAQVDRIIAAEEELRKKIENLEWLEARNNELAGHENRFKADAQEATQKTEYRDVFKKWIIDGTQSLSSEERSVLFNHRSEERALSATTGTAGGYTVPQGFYDQLIDAMKWYGGMRNVANVFSTATGNTLPIPTANNTAQVGAILAENAAASTQDVSFDQVTLGAYKYTSNIVLVPIELLQDSAFDIEAYIAKQLGERIGRINNTHFTTGTGTGQPQGIVTGAAVGKTGATGQTTSVTYDDLIDLIHSVDKAYRPNGQFMFHDNTLKALKKLKDADGRPLFSAGIAYGEADTINGYKYEINNDVASMAVSAKSIVFGDLKNYWIRDVKDIQIVRFNEKYMDAGQVGFVAFSRTDGKLINAGVNPVAVYQNSAT